MTTISPDAIRRLILEFFSPIAAFDIAAMVDVRIKVMLVDDLYCPVARNDILALARCNLLLMPPSAAKTQITDCDDYALQLKDAAAGMFRKRCHNGAAGAVPPALAIVISQNHAVNLFIEQGVQGSHSIWCIDASTPKLPITNDPEQAAAIMKQPPVKLIYM